LETFSIKAERQNEAVLVTARGDLDLAATEPAEQELALAERGSPELIVLDLAGVDFIDSSGLRVLLMAAERAGEAEHRFVVARASGQVSKVLEMTGSDALLELASGLPEPFAGRDEPQPV
jgi:anti-sigma B factor antagonist